MSRKKKLKSRKQRLMATARAELMPAIIELAELFNQHNSINKNAFEQLAIINKGDK